MPSRSLPVWSRRTALSTSRRRPPSAPTRAVVPMAGLLTALLAALVLGACGGSGPESPDAPFAAAGPASTTPAAAPDPGASTTSPATSPRVAERTTGGAANRTVPTLPDAATTRTVAGRDAFAEHVIDLWTHALATNDAAPLRALAPRGRCEGCATLTRELDGRAQEGWYVALDGVEVRELTGPRRVQPQRPATVVATVDIPATYSLNDDQTYRTSNPSHDGATFEVDVVWRQGRYYLLGYALTG